MKNKEIDEFYDLNINGIIHKIKKRDTSQPKYLDKKKKAKRTKEESDFRGMARTRWKSMHYRCKHDVSYRDVNVCVEWNDFENFFIWFSENYIKGWHLDKDLLSEGKKIYSPNTCVFLPEIVNLRLKSGKHSIYDVVNFLTALECRIPKILEERL